FPPGTLAWIDCAALTPTGVKRQVIYDFVNEMLTPAWQARFIKTSFNNGILDLAEATKAGVPEDILHKTNIPDMKDPEFWKKMIFFQNPENVDRRLGYGTPSRRERCDLSVAGMRDRRQSDQRPGSDDTGFVVLDGISKRYPGAASPALQTTSLTIGQG